MSGSRRSRVSPTCPGCAPAFRPRGALGGRAGALGGSDEGGLLALFEHLHAGEQARHADTRGERPGGPLVRRDVSWWRKLVVHGRSMNYPQGFVNRRSPALNGYLSFMNACF